MFWFGSFHRWRLRESRLRESRLRGSRLFVVVELGVFGPGCCLCQHKPASQIGRHDAGNDRTQLVEGFGAVQEQFCEQNQWVYKAVLVGCRIRA